MDRLRAHIGPLWPYALLVAIPLFGFVLPDLISGRLVITGDNLQQNYPLHVLVGSMLRHGELPFWNQYIFSGTPLMADFNAGAFYPLVGLFVALPDRAAWIATEVALFSAIAIGMYVFLRALKLSTVACLLGAVTFAFAGPVLSQVNHVDMTEGFVAIPWMLLALHHIVRDGRWRWAILLGIAYATVILGGAPEAMLDEALLVVGFAVMSAGLSRERWWRVLTRCATGAALALSLAAIQWLPGLEAIRNSQRGAGVFAAAGSYPTPFSIFALVPYLDGGYGHLGESQFFSHYNLPEVGFYLGVLPLIALITLLHPRWPSRLAPRDRLTWYAVGVFGYLLALGSNTPLERLFNRIPLYGHQRLQSRNMIIVATAVSVLFAGWLDRTDVPKVDVRWRRYDRMMALVPLALVAVLAVWALTATGSLVHVFAGVWASPGATHTVREATIIALGFAAVAAALVWLRPRLTGMQWAAAAAAFVAVDLGLMALTSQLDQAPANDLVSGTTPIQRLMAAHLSGGGRFINYDPQTYSSYPGSAQGVPDLNIIPGLPSVSGYASIVNSNYESVTHTHEQDDLDIGQLGSGTLDRLDLQEVVTVPEYFIVPLASAPRSLSGVQQVSEGFGSDPVLVRGYGADFNETAYPFYPGPRPALHSGQSESWFLGESLEPDSATILFTHASTSDALVRFGVLTADGSTHWGATVPVAVGADGVTEPLPRADAIGLSVQVVGSLPAHQAVISVSDHSYELAGSLSGAIVPGPWHQAGTSQGYSVYTFAKPPKPVSAATGTGRPLVVTVLSSTTKSEEIKVDAPSPSTVIRSVAWDSGWLASVSVNGGAAHAVSVNSFDLVQQVRIPAGHDVVTFRYRPPHLVLASVLSVGAVAVLVILLGGWLVLRRRRRPVSDAPLAQAHEPEAVPV
ncbi:MAG TPA: hypothetical protein VG244_10940 [Acidimicrobiales bacterium]|nr:hypothetical protein [Acidimicrobiales bacterium]